MARVSLAILLAVLMLPQAVAESRVPPPDFETGYERPVLTFQTRQIFAREIADAVVLMAALGLSASFLLRKRSRASVFVLGLSCLLYLGVYKKGCICPVGAIQNVTCALCRADYAVPIVVIAVFILPLIAALMWGRVFCGSVCPLGAIQDLFLFRPIRVPRWLEASLGLLRYFFLGLAVFFVADRSVFIICQYDPFVGFFRFAGPAWKYALGAGLLGLGMFIGRPYCRFLCPYGAILSLLARWTTSGVSITPDECIRCKLCDDACPFGAILRPAVEQRTSTRSKILLASLALLTLIALAIGGYFAGGKSVAGAILGLWFGLVIALKLISLMHRRERKAYEVDHAACLSCGRCYQWCPRERKRLAAAEARNG